MKTAIIHDWLTGMRGGEKILEVFCELYPRADLYTLLHIPGSVSKLIEQRRIFTSFLQRLPAVKTKYRYFLPLMPKAIECFNLNSYNLIISSSHCVAKGVRKPKNALHISYCYTPMRYIWDMYNEYFGKQRANLPQRAGISLFSNYLRKWDVLSSAGVDYFATPSENVRDRIRRYYHRDATVIHPFVDTERFKSNGSCENFYLIVSAFAPYKRLDIAIEAFNILGWQLKIIGKGQDDKKLRKIAKPNIKFLGWQPDEALVEYYSKCRALIFPGEEDSGIVPLEAMASGKPVIAYAKGGAKETVFDGFNGLLFREQSPLSLIEALHKFEKIKESFIPNKIRAYTLTFDRHIFKEKIKDFIGSKLKDAKKI